MNLSVWPTWIYLLIFGISFSASQLNEGDGCLTSRQENGVCSSVLGCQTIVQILLHKPISAENKTYLRQSICSWEKKLPLVCCKNITMSTTVTPPIKLNVGDQCFTSRREKGVCTNIHNCTSVIEMLRQNPLSAEDRAYLRKSICGFNGNLPVVCCVNNKNALSSTSAPMTITESPPRIGERQRVDNHPNLSLLPTIKCGKSFVQKIWGGSETGLGEYPWMALLGYHTSRDDVERFLCGGVIISHRYILTAAHCVVNIRHYTLISVRLGEHDLSQEPDCEVLDDERICAPPAVSLGVEKVIPHPEYHVRSKHNDIALIRLNSSINFSSGYISPICLPIEQETIRNNYVNDTLTVAGWGRVSVNVSSSNKKMHVQLPVVSNVRCAEAYYNYHREIVDSQLCAGGVVDKDSCTGDSGGPLMSADIKQKDGAIHYYVAGIVSYGAVMCGSAGIPGVYTRVASFSKWILDTLEE